MPTPPPNDEALAARIGRALEANAPLEAMDGAETPFVQALLAYREAAQGPAPEADTSERLWAAIEAEMEPGTAPEAPVRSSRRDRSPRRPERSGGLRLVWRMAAAAVVLAAVGVAVWLTDPFGGPDLVAQADDEIATYTTPDGSTVQLRPRSRLYRVDAEGADRYRLQGEGRFTVTPRPNRAFEVAADGAVVRVLGTRFTVQAWTEQPVVYLQEGRVELRSVATDRRAVLQPGQRGTLTTDGAVSVASVDPAPYLDWLDRELTFDSLPAREVAAELEQHYGLAIRLPDAVATDTLSGRILLDTPTQSLRDFGTVLGGRFEETEAGMVFVRRDETGNR